MRYRLCDLEGDASGVSVELRVEAEPFAEAVAYALTLAAGGAPIATVEAGELTPAELFALGHAFRDAAADGFGHFAPRDETFGLDMAPPATPLGLDEVAVSVWVDAGRAAGGPATRSGVAVQLVVEASALGAVADAVCEQASHALSG